MRAWRDYLPEFLPLPHPSWRNTGWLKRNPWFESELLPELRARVRGVLAASASMDKSGHAGAGPAPTDN